MTARYDAVVVGAGAMGSAAAWWLARRGRSVALVEQFEAGHTRGSSHGASRIFRYAYDDPVMVRLVMEARPLWDELQDDAGETLLDQIGALDHGDPPTVEALAAAMAAAGVPNEAMPPAAAGERWPHLRFEGTRRPPAHGRAVPGRRHGRRAGSARRAITAPTCGAGWARRRSAPPATASGCGPATRSSKRRWRW